MSIQFHLNGQAIQTRSAPEVNLLAVLTKNFAFSGAEFILNFRSH